MKSWPLQVPVLITNDLTSAHPHSVHVWKVVEKKSQNISFSRDLYHIPIYL